MKEGSANSVSRRALITGASAGIGAAFARVLAENGCNLVLVARRRDRLDRLAHDLAVAHGVHVDVLVADLAAPQMPERIVAELGARALTIDILVNNAGYGVPGSYASTTWVQQRDFLQVLVVAVAELTHRLLPGMIDRRWGRIINVASFAGLVPAVAGHTLYAAAKAFVISFSESLALETARHGIHVTASCPGFTLSEFHDVTGTRAQVNRMPKFMWLDADEVARGSVEAVTRGDLVYVPGRLYRSLAVASRLMSRRMTRAVMTRNAGSFRNVD